MSNWTPAPCPAFSSSCLSSSRLRITNQETGCIDLSIVQAPHARDGLMEEGVHWVVGGTAQACDAADRLKEGVVVVVVVVGERTGSWERIERRRRET